jgi:hypothetical protein
VLRPRAVPDARKVEDVLLSSQIEKLDTESRLVLAWGRELFLSSSLMLEPAAVTRPLSPKMRPRLRIRYRPLGNRPGLATDYSTQFIMSPVCRTLTRAAIIITSAVSSHSSG